MPQEPSKEVVLNALQKTAIMTLATGEGVSLNEQEVQTILQVRNVLQWPQPLRKKLAPYLNLVLNPA